jgi:hypothetical protein
VAVLQSSGGPERPHLDVVVDGFHHLLRPREQLGGSVVGKHLDPGPGAPKFAYLRDPAGNQFGVFTPPAA